MADDASIGAVLAEAVTALHRTLADGGDVSGALRWCYYRNPVFAGTLFREMATRQFGVDGDIREITRFVDRVRDNQPEQALGFPARETEAIIRGALGEIGFIWEVPPDQISYPEVGIMVLATLFAERQLRTDEVDALFACVADMVTAEHELAPEHGELEAAWFRAGWHMSPFAVTDGEDEGGQS